MTVVKRALDTCSLCGGPMTVIRVRSTDRLAFVCPKCDLAHPRGQTVDK